MTKAKDQEIGADASRALRMAILNVERKVHDARDAIDGGHECSSALFMASKLCLVVERLASRMTKEELHSAFGAPGDYGYETEIGDALSTMYRELWKAKA